MNHAGAETGGAERDRQDHAHRDGGRDRDDLAPVVGDEVADAAPDVRDGVNDAMDGVRDPAEHDPLLLFLRPGGGRGVPRAST